MELFFFLSFRPAWHKNVMEIYILYYFKRQDRVHPFSEFKTKVTVEIFDMLQNYKMWHWTNALDFFGMILLKYILKNALHPENKDLEPF